MGQSDKGILVGAERENMIEMAVNTVSNSNQEFKRETIVSELREAILSGKLAGGQTLYQSEIAKQFSVSRQPVREALMVLYAEGLVKLDHRRRVVVTRLSAEEAQELMEIRSILEGAIAGYAAENITSEDLHELRKLLERMGHTIDNIAEYFPLNREFHNRIIKAANKKHLAEMTLNLRNATENYGRLGMAFAETRKNVFHPQHYQIVDALEHRDKDRVERLMREHMLIGARNLGLYIQNLKLT